MCRTSQVASAIAVGVLVLAGAGCSGGPAGSGGNSLKAALSHVADTASTRSEIWYDDTAELARVAVRNPAPSPKTVRGFAGLRELGAPTIADYLYSLRSDTGISLLSEDYAISAGHPPEILTLLDGGQDAARVTSRLARQGWKRGSGGLAAPPQSSASASALKYALAMVHVRPSGPNVAFGGYGADLSEIGAPPGPTLAGDSRISALADCLGNVVAAAILSGGRLGGKNPAAVAAGVRPPGANTAVAHAVVCVAWPSQAQAARFTADLRRALSAGLSPATNERYSALLGHASVTDVGGSQHVIRWQADTPGYAASRIFLMLESTDLPALPDCGRLSNLPPGARAHVAGCS